MAASELRDDLRPGNCEKMATCKVRPLDLWECKSFDAKLKVWEVTTPVEGAKLEVHG